MNHYQRILAKEWNRGNPLSANFELTFRCNLKCEFCYNVDDAVARELSTPQILETLGKLADVGVLYCALTGARDWFLAATSLSVFGVGAVFLAAGALGQYLGRVYRQVAGEFPAYVVQRGPLRSNVVGAPRPLAAAPESERGSAATSGGE